jgi:replicative DNA helicase
MSQLVNGKTASQKFTEEKLQANTEAEEKVLCCLLDNPRAISKVVDYLKSDHFFRDTHRTIYKAFVKLYQQERLCSVDNIIDELERRGRLEEVGGRGHLLFLANAFAQDGVEAHAENVIHKAKMRRLSYAASEILKLALDEDDNAMERAQQIIFEIAMETDMSQTITFTEALAEYMTDLKKRRQEAKDGAAQGLPTGYVDLDRLLGGLQPGALCTVGALTGFGKSALSTNIALNIAIQSKHVMLVSLEMSHKEIVQRILATDAEIDQSSLRDATLDDQEMYSLEIRAKRLQQCDIKIEDRAYSIGDICAKVKRVHSRKKLDLIIVDYLQLIETIETRNKNTTRAQEVADLSRRLKRLAQELQIPVMVLVQLNRKVEDRQEQIPKLSDINESGGIARDSDVVMFLYSTAEEIVKRENNEPYQITVRVAKNRNGRLHEINLMFCPRITKFISLEAVFNHGDD